MFCCYHVHSKFGLSNTEQCPCGTGSPTTEHLLQSCPIYELPRKGIWPGHTPVARKLYSSLGEPTMHCHLHRGDWSFQLTNEKFQQHASVSQGRICSDKYTCCHTETEVADQTFYLTHSQYTDTEPTSPSSDSIKPGARQGSHWSANFYVTGMTRPGKIRRNPPTTTFRKSHILKPKVDLEPAPLHWWKVSVRRADVLTITPRVAS